MILRLVILILLLIPIVLILPRLITALSSRHLTYKEINPMPQSQVAIVFGAGLWRDGSPTPVLRDRVSTAVDLYFAGKVERLLMSGDNSITDYNEPGAMRNFALQLGVPNEAIVLDYAGRRTYDTCYRARDIFKVKEATLVTQGFHLPRALYICNALGVTAVGIPADRRSYRRGSIFYWNLREVPATLVALWEIYVTKPLPLLGKSEPIFPMEAQ